MLKFNEDTRVKIPSILHLTRLGYQYLSKEDVTWDEGSNIFTDLFKKSISKINPDADEGEINRLLEETKLTLDNEDLGTAFYEKIINQSGLKIIDFSNFDNNNFHVITELPYKSDEEEFRPDITLLINGLPLAFIEVKKPNNPEGVLAERNRIITRFQNKKFRRFVNITQFMVFSNNMEYNDDDLQPIQGAFYASSSYDEPIFNYFREEEIFDLGTLLHEEDDDIENYVLKDNNLISIKHSPEFKTNKDPNTPTNRLSTSLFSRDRLKFILQYAFAYVKESNGIKKHIMRYPQIFATKAIEAKLDEGARKGIVWHTQGSGKTALAYYNVKFLTDYFQQQSVIPKFYFIVDRIDLLTQAHREFASRGLVVHTINSREEFAKEIKSTSVIHNYSGKPEITVVNIQKFQDDPDVISNQDYGVNVQRIYFLDEVHRSYNPKGSFLANLNVSDPEAIMIGLTGTPLLGDAPSKLLFGDYIHKYYYNASIADGYTLRLIREEIESGYKSVLSKSLKDIKVLEGDIEKKLIYAHHQFVEPMLEYIVEDFQKSRMTLDDSSIGGMVICDSSEQAKMMHEIFQEKYECKDFDENEATSSFSERKKEQNKVRTAALILHDVGTKQDRKDWVEDFKDGKIDFLFVYNMLLTGFDSPRLKKLYMGRVIKKHNLLQALTRVNRTHNAHRYGYVVDFADISKEFDATNKAYFEELNSILGDDLESYSNLFKSKEEIEQEISQIENILFKFDTDNAEVFSQQITAIQDRKQIQTLKNVLADAKSIYNMIRLLGHYELLDKVDFKKLNIFYREVCNHLDLLNLKEKIEGGDNSKNLVNEAMEDIYFTFRKIDEKELVIADKLKTALRKTRQELVANYDKKDPKYSTLWDELKRLFEKKNVNEVTQEEMNSNIELLNEIMKQARELNRENELIKAKYQQDEKFARIHKRVMESDVFPNDETVIFNSLVGLKERSDAVVLLNSNLLHNESYFGAEISRLIIESFNDVQNFEVDINVCNYIETLIVNEYMHEFNGRVAC